MKEKLFKFFPYLFGLTIGYLLVSPPEWFRSLGLIGYLLMGLLCLCLLIAVFMLLISANLPADMQLTPVTENAVADLQPLADRMKALGFVTAGPPLKVEISPPGFLVPFFHEAWGAYGIIFRTGTIPSKTSYEFVTILEKEPGGLTTVAAAGADVFPLMAGEWRQVFPETGIEDLFQQHAAAVTWLHDRGEYRRAVTAETFIPDMKAAFARKRKHFFSSPLLMTLQVVVNSAMKKVPHRGPLAEQKA